jgi:hypothetical protein
VIAFLKRQLGVSKQLLKNRLRKNRGKRRYIHPKLGVQGFFEALKDRNINYAVLRWFESLPQVADGEDIDILVSDEDIHRLEPFLTGTKSYGTPCDIYTTSGLPGTSYRGIAYFPEHLARELLDTAVWQNGLVRVPDTQRHLFSMAYHATYHKGYESGIPSATGKSLEAADQDHDYSAALRACEKKAGISLPELTLEGLDHFLQAHNWSPARDALEKLSARNPWIRDRFFTDLAALETHWKGFSVFIVREQGLEHLDLVRTMLFDAGFDILFETAIEGNGRANAARNLRGGNWNRGPWPMSGGLPAWLFAVDDCFPVAPGKELAEKHQGLVNARLLDTKIRIRDAVNKLKPHGKQSNVIHSADNPHQGLEYFNIVCPDEEVLSGIGTELQKIHDSLRDRFPVIQRLSSHGRRAKVELVSYAGIEAVCKTYRPGRERFLERELLARSVGKDLPEMTPILESGSNYFLLPRYHDQLNRNKPLPLWMLRRTKTIISHFRSQGYELIDFKPKNILMDKTEGMKILDFEFLQSGGTVSSELAGNFCWYAVGSTFEGDLPVGKKGRRTNYHRHWFAATGIPLFFAVHDLPDFVLVVVRWFGRVALFLRHTYSGTVRAINMAARAVKRYLITLLSRLIG